MARRSFNPKRRLCPSDQLAQRKELLLERIEEIRYTGNPEHKRNPGDFKLTPPIAPRAGKTLCDQVQVHSRAEALALLREGLRRGAFSAQERNEWPQNIWAVTERGEPVEAQHEGGGAYHGYPMPESDPLREKILEMWRSA